MDPTKLFYEIQYYDISKEYPKEFVYVLAALVKDYIYYSYTFQAYRNEISISKDLCKTNFTKNKEEYYRLRDILNIQEPKNTRVDTDLKRLIYSPNDLYISLSDALRPAKNYKVMDLFGQLAEYTVQEVYWVYSKKEEDFLQRNIRYTNALNVKTELNTLLKETYSKSDREDMEELIEYWYRFFKGKINV